MRIADAGMSTPECFILANTYIWGRPRESSEPYLMLTYILWSSDFTECLQHYFMDLHHTLDIGSVWPYE